MWVWFCAHTVQCRLCVHNDRETRVGLGVKHKQTNYMKIYMYRFDRSNIFNTSPPNTSTIGPTTSSSISNRIKVFWWQGSPWDSSILDNAKNNLKFVIHQSNIVNFLIGELFFNPEQEEEDNVCMLITKANAMKLFKIQEDGSYFVTITNPLCFWLAIDYTSVGLLLRQTVAVVTQHQNRCKNHKLAGLRDHMVSQFTSLLLLLLKWLPTWSLIRPCGHLLWQRILQLIAGFRCLINGLECVS